MGYFWNKVQVHDTPVYRYSKLLEYVLNNLNNARAQTKPIYLEEESMVAI